MSSSAFPPPPSTEIDWSNVGFQVREVNCHIECKYSVKTGRWTEPEAVIDPFLRIHGMAPGLNYGQQCYEGQKAFRTPSGTITIFRPTLNALRMQHSASVVSMPPVPEDMFLRCVHLAVGLNAEYVPPSGSGASMYIRPLMFGSSAQLGLSPPDEYLFVVYVMPTGVYHGVHAVDALVLEDFDRSAPEGTGHAKIGGNYAPVLRHSDKARTEGFGITLHLDSRTRSEIDEFSTSGFIGVKKSTSSESSNQKHTLVVPASTQIIDSVTSASIVEIAAKSFGWKIEKRAVKFEELESFSEVMAAGTAASLVPIRSITMRSKEKKIEYLKSEEPGELCLKLLRKLQGIQRGEDDDAFGWCQKLEKPEGVIRREVGGGAGEGSGKASKKSAEADQLD